MLIDSLRYFFIGLVLLFLQYFVIQEINFGTWIKPMPYIYLIFILPFSMNRYLKLTIAFLLGLVLDAIGNTYGMHTAAITTLCFTKIYVDKWFLDIDAIQLQGYNYLTPAFKGMTFFLRYAVLFIFIHHIVFFTFNYFKWSSFFLIIGVSILSTIATFVFILLYRFITKRG